MSHTLGVFRSANDLIYGELPPDYGNSSPPDPSDTDAIKNENALAFYRFELALLQVFGVQDQLETHAAAQEKLARDGQQPVEQDVVWMQIQQGVQNTVAQVACKIQDADTTVVSEHEAIDDPVAKLGRYTDSIERTGGADNTLRTSLLPSSAGELLAQVARRTGLNTLVAWWIRRMFSPASAEPVADNENARKAERADALYRLLTARRCSGKDHAALLQLSGWSNSSEGNMVFELFLSHCQSDGGWQKVTCTFESSKTDKGRRSQSGGLCSDIRIARRRHVPLFLSFNNDRLWTSRPARDVLSEREERPDCVNLDTLLSQGDLSTSDLNDRVGKFRLALRLASSLCSLYLGPWIHRDWSSRSVHVIRDGSRKLDEAYISCHFTTADRQGIHAPQAPFQETSSTDTCPRFFVSLAQLLVDIAKGERSCHFSDDNDLDHWYDVLVDEVRRNTDPLMRNYWNAIQGCLLYLENRGAEVHDSPSEEVDERLQAQKVIQEHIVRHLQKHLDFWEVQLRREARSVEDAASGGTLSRLRGRAQRSVGAPIGDSSSAATSTPSQPSARPTVETKFILWSDTDEDYTIIPMPTEEPTLSSFISHMNRFRDKYIETLPEPKGDGDAAKRVRVAIVDTGFYIEEADLDRDGDPFLDHPDVRSRVVGQRNFFSPDDTDPDADDFKDEHGHGTQVARLVLQFAPRAEVIVAKICNSKTFKTTKTSQLVDALRWAGQQADIINLSFGLGSMPEPEVDEAIKELVSNNKLIFAAASNTGGYGSRPWPASRKGVFAIHATNEFATVDNDMNPQPVSGKDNFAIFGCGVASYWDGHHRLISGTSFATPVAAAIAANILEFARRKQPECVEGLTRYSAMRRLFREHMTMNKVDGVYHCFHPWASGLWDGGEDSMNVKEVLWEVSI